MRKNTIFFLHLLQKKLKLQAHLFNAGPTREPLH